MIYINLASGGVLKLFSIPPPSRLVAGVNVKTPQVAE